MDWTRLSTFRVGENHLKTLSVHKCVALPLQTIVQKSSFALHATYATPRSSALTYATRRDWFTFMICGSLLMDVSRICKMFVMFSHNDVLFSPLVEIYYFYESYMFFTYNLKILISCIYLGPHIIIIYIYIYYFIFLFITSHLYDVIVLVYFETFLFRILSPRRELWHWRRGWGWGVTI